MKLQGSNILGQEQIDLLTTRGLNFVWFPKQGRVKLEVRHKPPN